MRRNIIFILIIMIFSLVAHAEFEYIPVSVKEIAMAGAGTAFHKDIEGVHVNCAGIANLKRGQIYTFSTEQFSLSELKTSFIAYGSKIKGLGAFALSNIDFGNEDYSENTYTVSFAREMFENSMIGVNVKHLNVYIKNTEQESGTAIDIAFTGKIYGTGYAISVRNANAPKLNEVIPRTISFGLEFDNSKNAKTYFDINKVDSYGNIENDPSIRIGQVFRLADKFRLFGGYASRPYKISGGFSLEFSNRWEVDYAFSSMKDLPVTHSIAFKMNI
ncbi:MAG: hypothetical protein C0601_09305 [Candidatus Muiribacterium halophilum]|uniref:DUF5723 domain-containing protein n=1 Tax=Muiribacterium halophilum TaxID=2053465 RepID=A0A2N5ZDM8_MUIH1|nr:MAG: hypothetical protein C0601_09305 [Candidatus Muirbacterium halophilum]